MFHQKDNKSETKLSSQTPSEDLLLSRIRERAGFLVDAAKITDVSADVDSSCWMLKAHLTNSVAIDSLLTIVATHNSTIIAHINLDPDTNEFTLYVSDNMDKIMQFITPINSSSALTKHQHTGVVNPVSKRCDNVDSYTSSAHASEAHDTVYREHSGQKTTKSPPEPTVAGVDIFPDTNYPLWVFQTILTKGATDLNSILCAGHNNCAIAYDQDFNYLYVIIGAGVPKRTY